MIQRQKKNTKLKPNKQNIIKPADNPGPPSFGDWGDVPDDFLEDEDRFDRPPVPAECNNIPGDYADLVNVESVTTENENMYQVRVFNDTCLKCSLYPSNITSMCKSDCEKCSKLLVHHVTCLFNILSSLIDFFQ